MEITVIDVLAPILTCEWNLTNAHIVTFTASLFGGMAVGNLILGNFADTYGRKKTILFAAVQVCFMALTSAFSPNFVFLVLSRTIFGAFLAYGYQGMSLILEFSPKKQRAFVNMICAIFWAGGMMLGVIIGLLLRYFKSWRIYLLILASPAFIAVIITMKIPESARFLNVRGEKQKAMSLLHNIALKNGKNLRNFVLKEEGNTESLCFWDLFNKTHRKTSCLMSIYVLCNFAAYYGLVFLQPYFVWQRSSEKHQDYHCKIKCYELSEDYISLLWPSLLEVSGACTFSLIWDKFGRVKPTIISLLTSSIGCSLLFLNVESLEVTTVIFCMNRLSCYLAQSVSVLYIAELYPTEIRGMGVGLGCGANKFGSLIGPILTQSLFVVSPHLSIGSVLVWSLLSALSLIFLKKETLHTEMKDKTLPLVGQGLEDLNRR